MQASNRSTDSKGDETCVMTRLEIARSRLELYREAERAILAGAQSYQIGNRNLTRGSLAEIRKMIDSLQDEIEALEGKPRGYSRRVTIMD